MRSPWRGTALTEPKAAQGKMIKCAQKPTEGFTKRTPAHLNLKEELGVVCE